MEDIKKVDSITENKTVATSTSPKETKEQDNSDVFVGENDVFDVEIKYYKEGGNLIVENIDESFKKDHENIKSIKMVFRYPSVKDAQSIINSSDNKMGADFSLTDLMKLQDVRIMILLKSWSLKETVGDISNFNTKILKAIRFKVSDAIGMDGII